MATESAHLHKMRKMLSPHFFSDFTGIFVKLAGKEDRHKISEWFELGLSQTFHDVVICP